MKNFLQAMAIIAVAYGLYHSGWIEGFGPRYEAVERETEDNWDTAEYEFEPEPEPEAALSRADEEAMLADFESTYTPPNHCLGDLDSERCLAHKEDTLNRFRGMWKQYYNP